MTKRRSDGDKVAMASLAFRFTPILFGVSEAFCMWLFIKLSDSVTKCVFTQLGTIFLCRKSVQGTSVTRKNRQMSIKIA